MRRFFVGLAATELCEPGKPVTMKSVFKWEKPARYARLCVPPQYAGFDVLALVVNGKPQMPECPVPATSFADRDNFIEGDELAPGCEVMLTVVNRYPPASYFGAALYVEEVEPKSAEQTLVDGVLS